MQDESNNNVLSGNHMRNVLETDYKTVPLRYVFVKDIESLNVSDVNNFEIGKQSRDVASTAEDDGMCNDVTRNCFALLHTTTPVRLGNRKHKHSPQTTSKTESDSGA